MSKASSVVASVTQQSRQRVPQSRTEYRERRSSQFRRCLFGVFRTVIGCCCRQNSGGRSYWSPWSRQHCSQKPTTVSASLSPSTHSCANHGRA